MTGLSGANHCGLSGADMFWDHTCLILFENIAAGTTFEMEVVWHLEGIPSDQGEVLEARMVNAGAQSPMELLNKVTHQHVIGSPYDDVLAGTPIYKTPTVMKAVDYIK